jgi:ABC-type dipeptide/oligopeptide/nickel transport system permease subunit
VSGPAASGVSGPAADAAAGTATTRTWGQRVWARYRRNWSALAATAVLLLVALSAAFAGLLAPHDPAAQDLANRFRPPLGLAGGSLAYPLGTDGFGRDVLSRLLYGGRVSLVIGFVCSTISAAIGITLGLLAGYLGGKIDAAIMRLADVQLGFPFIVLAIAVIAILGSALPVLVGLLSLAGWVYYGRITRGQALRLRHAEYVEAARVIGAGPARIIGRHVLPNVLSPNLVIWTFAIATLILIESSLSFLGVGVQPPTPSWGNMLSDGRTYVDDAWWLAIFPGLAITVTVLAVNTLGDALRDILDPRLGL